MSFCTVIVLCALGLTGAKAALHVYFDEMIIETIDPMYLDPKKTEVFIVEGSTDDNTITTNITVVKKIPEDADGRLKLVGMSMGAYTLPTGVDITMKLCEMLDEPIIMGPFLSVVGFTRDTCPPEPGNYFNEGYTLPMESLPDDFPENKYLAIFQILYKGQAIISINVYVDIQY